ncbi:FeS assembly SUF system protein [Porphyromonadaceae bacterium COT-184 OH4590]|nr:FeS assembly SUF system protein [Porphyromonadaceae bacterium COT-184 OH4590]MDO4726295.1 iron-sulfur cluster assembly protein [Porphyromonadaceae bacterium]
MADNNFLQLEERIVAVLKTVYDPEIPVDIYNLGLIYDVDCQENGVVVITMTLTAPNCPMADFILEDTKQKVSAVEGVNSVEIRLVFEPEWDRDMMSEEAKLELGLL